MKPAESFHTVPHKPACDCLTCQMIRRVQADAYETGCLHGYARASGEEPVPASPPIALTEETTGERVEVSAESLANLAKANRLAVYLGYRNAHERLEFLEAREMELSTRPNSLRREQHDETLRDVREKLAAVRALVGTLPASRQMHPVCCGHDMPWSKEDECFVCTHCEATCHPDPS